MDIENHITPPEAINRNQNESRKEESVILLLYFCGCRREAGTTGKARPKPESHTRRNHAQTQTESRNAYKAETEPKRTTTYILPMKAEKAENGQNIKR